MSSSKVKRPILAVIVILVVAVAAIGIYFATQTTPSAPVSSTTAASTSSAAALPTTLTVDEPIIVSSMDPGTVFDNSGLEVAQNTNLPLTFCANTACSELVPVLASSWTSSPDGMTYTFLLRKGVYYSNGDPFNAYVVWWNIYRNMIINQGADFIFYFYFTTNGVTAADVNALNNPQNMPDSNLLKVMMNPQNSVTVLNESAVQFHLTSPPFVPFLTTINTCPWCFIDPYVVEQNGGLVPNTPNSYMATNGTNVGNGPYISQVYFPGQYDVLIANPNYWAQNLTGSDTNFILQPAKIPKVIINYKTDELTRSLDLQNGVAQASVISFDDIKKVQAACQNCVVPDIGPSGTIEWVAINTLRAPLDNVLLRRAIVAGVNVTQIRQIVYSGYGVPVVGPNLVGFQYYDNSIQPPDYNVTLAKQLLAEAGYPDGKGLPPLNYYFSTSTYQALIGQVIKANLAEVGVTVNLRETSQAEMNVIQSIPGQNSTAPDMWSTQLTYYPDFSGYEIIVDNRFNVFGNVHNDTIYNLVLKSNAELDPAARARDISQITQLTQQSASMIWLGQDLDTYDTGAGVGPVLFNKCLAGMWYNTAMNGITFNSVYYACSP